MTLYSHDPAIHNALVGADGFDDTVAGIRAAVAAGLSVSVNTPLCSLNTAYDETLRFVHGLGVRYVTCSGLIPSGGAVGDESRATALTGAAAHRRADKGRGGDGGAENGAGLHQPRLAEGGDAARPGPDPGAQLRCLPQQYGRRPKRRRDPLPELAQQPPLGNILADDWDKIWQSERCAAIRAKSAKMEQLCQLRESNREEGTLC